jgi:hypothetical protein
VTKHLTLNTVLTIHRLHIQTKASRLRRSQSRPHLSHPSSRIWTWKMNKHLSRLKMTSMLILWILVLLNRLSLWLWTQIRMQDPLTITAQRTSSGLIKTLLSPQLGAICKSRAAQSRPSPLVWYARSSMEATSWRGTSCPMTTHLAVSLLALTTTSSTWPSMALSQRSSLFLSRWRTLVRLVPLASFSRISKPTLTSSRQRLPMRYWTRNSRPILLIARKILPSVPQLLTAVMVTKSSRLSTRRTNRSIMLTLRLHWHCLVQLI